MAFAKRYMKYVVSSKCLQTLRDELGKMNLVYSFSPHGAVEFLEETTPEQLEELNHNLLISGLELLDKNESLLIDRIIGTVVEVIHHSDKLPNLSYRDIIDLRLGSKSESILKIFSDVKGISIMQFIVLQKVERVKELLIYDELSLTEIAEKLRYKNKHFLIAQFKKHTGLPPEYFIKLKNERMSILQNA